MTAQELRAAIDAKAEEARAFWQDCTSSAEAFWQDCTSKAAANEAEIRALEGKLAASG